MYLFIYDRERGGIYESIQESLFDVQFYCNAIRFLCVLSVCLCLYVLIIENVSI